MTTLYSRRHTRKNSDHEYVVMMCDTPNANGRIYPLATGIDVVQKFNSSPTQMVGGFMDDIGYAGTVDLEQVAHVVTGLEMRGKEMVAKIRPLNTPKGQILAGLIALDLVEFRTGGLFSGVFGSGIIRDFQLTTIFALAKGEGA
jgi:hypothetical protein